MMWSPPKIDADGYRYYGQWAGNPKGHRQVKSRCIVEVAGYALSYHQCQRNRGHGPNGDYCRQHAKKLPPAAPREVP